MSACQSFTAHSRAKSNLQRVIYGRMHVEQAEWKFESVLRATIQPFMLRPGWCGRSTGGHFCYRSTAINDWLGGVESWPCSILLPEADGGVDQSLASRSDSGAPCSFLNADTELSRKCEGECCDYTQNRTAILSCRVLSAEYYRVIRVQRRLRQGRIRTAMHGNHVSHPWPQARRAYKLCFSIVPTRPCIDVLLIVRKRLQIIFDIP